MLGKISQQDLRKNTIKPPSVGTNGHSPLQCVVSVRKSWSSYSCSPPTSSHRDYVVTQKLRGIIVWKSLHQIEAENWFATKRFVLSQS